MDEVEDGEEDISNGGKFPSFQMPKSMVDFSWDLGTYFTDNEAFKDAIRSYVVNLGNNLKLIKNDNTRVCVCVFEPKDTINGMHTVGTYPQQVVGS